MKISRRVLIIALILGPFLLIGFMFPSFIQDNFVIPIALVLLLGWRIVQSIDQQIYWFVLIFAAALYALIRLYRLFQVPDTFEQTPSLDLNGTLEQINYWQTSLRLTDFKIDRSDLLSRNLAKMLATVYASKQTPCHTVRNLQCFGATPDYHCPNPFTLSCFRPNQPARSDPSNSGCATGGIFPASESAAGQAAKRPNTINCSSKRSNLWNRLWRMKMTTNASTPITIEQVAGLSDQIIQEVEKAIVGKRQVLTQIMAAFLASGGHILLEDYPGLAKTLIANSFASALGLGFNRIQFTPDLLPGDITGGYVFDSNQNSFQLRKGPLFTNIVLADEINRASPKTQSALLEAMQEYQVTLEGESLALPNPFIVIATQNPIEYEGTFPLPEAQLDRFMVKLSIGYPRPEEEEEILKRRAERKQDNVALQAVITPEVFLAMRAAVEEVYIDPDVRRYMVELAAGTRRHQQVVVGVSPRGSLALLKLTRAWAALQGRDFVVPDDVKLFARPALAHRLILDPNLWGSNKTENAVIDQVLSTVRVPVIQGIHE